MNLYAIKNLLNKGFPYTIIYFDRTGYLHTRHFVLDNVVIKHDDKDYLLIIIKGNKAVLKWDKFIRIDEDMQFVLWEGTLMPNTSPVWSTGLLQGSYGAVSVVQRLTYQDGRYLIRAKESLKNKSLVENINQLGPEVIYNYQCTSEKQY